MNKTLRIVAAFMLCSLGASAQQDIALTHFFYNRFAVNPGATGMEGGICGNLIYRNQWDKVNGAPNSVVFNADAFLPSFGIRHSGGVGINFTHDAIGFNRQNNLMLNYSYHLELGNGTLGIGASVGFVNFGMNPVWVGPQTQVDATFPGSSSAMTFDANFGVYYKTQNWFAGISATHLPAMSLGLTSSIATANNVAYDLSRHYYAMGGWNTQIGTRGKIDLQAFLETDARKLSGNLTARYIHNNMMYGGLGFRNSDAIAVLLGFRALNFKNNRGNGFLWVGYSYDITIGRLSSISNGTHEMAVKFCWTPKIPITKSKHPRWL
jgi:type IX secretion system PorP/SprF family membrane protein